MPSIGDALGALLGNDTLNQIFLYNLLGTGLSVVMEAYTRELEYDLNSRTPNVPLSPAELSTAVVRGFRAMADAAQEAAESGIDAGRFETLVQLSGLAPSPGELAEALRRGIIPYDAGDATGVGFVQGIAQGNLANKWSDMFRALSVEWPTPTDALNALLEGQIDDQTARDLYQKFGGDPDYFQMLYDSRGNAPTPLEAAEMARRGLIPVDGTGPGVVSYQQAFLEGPWRNKWLDPYWRLTEYHPPPRTITAMLREGSIDQQEASSLLAQAGVPADLIPAYLSAANNQKTAGTKDLAQSIVVKLYTDHLIDAAMATDMLKSLGYDDKNAGFILAVADIQIEEAQLSSVLGRIRTLYEGHKIDTTQARNALNALQIPAAQVDRMLAVWALARQANVKELTASDIFNAFKYEIIDQGTAIDQLGRIGYLPYDAWLYLSAHIHIALPDPPAPGDISPPSSQ